MILRRYIRNALIKEALFGFFLRHPWISIGAFGAGIYGLTHPEKVQTWLYGPPELRAAKMLMGRYDWWRALYGQ
ncbi:MAG: hypothetical protein QXO15_09780 [Nitrososphaerota archaeon]